jgi:CheY-like chemotaxis protein
MRRALVVDDASDIRLLLRSVLRGRGFDVDEAANGVEALDLLASGERPDVIVLDVQMPQLDGWDTLVAIRGDPSTSEVPVILCTVRSQPADAERAWLLGCDGFVAKPFAVDDLVRRVEDACARSLEERVADRQRNLDTVRVRAGFTGPEVTR